MKKVWIVGMVLFLPLSLQAMPQDDEEYFQAPVKCPSFLSVEIQATPQNEEKYSPTPVNSHPSFLRIEFSLSQGKILPNLDWEFKEKPLLRQVLQTEHLKRIQTDPLKKRQEVLYWKRIEYQLKKEGVIGTNCSHAKDGTKEK